MLKPTGRKTVDHEPSSNKHLSKPRSPGGLPIVTRDNNLTDKTPVTGMGGGNPEMDSHLEFPAKNPGKMGNPHY